MWAHLWTHGNASKESLSAIFISLFSIITMIIIYTLLLLIFKTLINALT